MACNTDFLFLQLIYLVDDAYLIHWAMDEIASHTCIRFVPANPSTHKNWIKFVQKSG